MIYLNLLFILLFIIFIHELGHYCAARFFGAKVTDFSIGFGKPLYSFKDKLGTNWKFSLILLGGYVKIKGLESIFSKDIKNEYDIDSFESLNLYKKIIILLSGCLFNIFSVWIFLFCISFFIGTFSFTPEVGKVFENSAADKNDIRIGDIIIKVNGNDIQKFRDIGRSINNQNFVSIELIRDNKILHKDFELIFDEKINRYLIGITTNNKPIIDKYNYINSFSNSTYDVLNIFKVMFIHLNNSIRNNTLSNDLAGPIGIVKSADQLMLNSFQGISQIFIIISIGIVIINLLPIPLLDGGHVIYFILRSIFANQLPYIVTRIYIAIGLTIISTLFIFITYNDIFYK